MTINERQFGSIAVLDLSGAIAGRDAATALDAAVRRHATRGTRALVANLGNVPSIDLGGLGTLVEGFRVMRTAGGVLTLADVARRIHDLIVITRLVTVFRTFDSVEDALFALAGMPAEVVPEVPAAALASVGPFLRRA